ncbi:hypothetical protein DVR12_05540 [Chitinophaga silvatica]|uniref:Uncharacterized protein n=1 Tax=Chitinophaga silvatica TaxID=2282649 RepID=A0A3E1YDQ6_9BACT|nr:hypothetical protein [Chitinophaga silvatica]RFS24666.1 hypothetical protein DVR12_05540 [Chitinophaga silvatica]
MRRKKMWIKLKKWFKNPRNIVFTILMTGVAIIAIKENAIEVYFMVFALLYLLGIIVGLLINLCHKFFK